jgi:hypothetical protein
MKPLHLLIALLAAVVPVTAADQKDPKQKPKTAREKREEQDKKKEQEKAEREKKAGRDKEKKADAPKSNLPPRSGLAPTAADKPMTDAELVALLVPFDKNGDYQIDVTEFTEIEAAFKKNSSGPLKQFDKAKDGDLDGLIDRAYMNVKLGAATPPKKNPPAPAPPPPAPAAPKAPEATKPAAPDATKPAAPAPSAPAPAPSKPATPAPDAGTKKP